VKKSKAKIIIPLQNRGEISFSIVVVRKYRMFFFAGILLGLLGSFSFCGQNAVLDHPSAQTDEVNLPEELTVAETAWGTFKIGSWVRMRTTTTTFQEKTTHTVAESTMVLEAVEPDGILLKQTDSVAINGKMVPGEPQQKKIDFYQQLLTGNVDIQELDPEEIPVGNRTFLCGVRVYEQTTSQLRRRTKVWFNPKVAPYVLRTETTRTSLPTPEQPTGKPLGQSVTTVLNPPKATFRGSLFGTYRMQTIKKNADGTTIYSLAECSLRIPGGIERERSWEYDRENNLIRTQTTTFSDTARSSEAKPVDAVVNRQPSAVNRQ